MRRRRDLLENAAFAQGREAQAGAVCDDQNGTNGYFTCPAEYSGDLSIELLVYIDTADIKKDATTIFSALPGLAVFIYRKNSIEFKTYPKSPAVSLTLYTSFLDKAWNHLTYTLQGLEAKVYLNGQLKTAGVNQTYPFDAKNNTIIGNFSTSNNWHFDNIIGSVRRFNYAMSASEVAMLWNGGDPAGYVVPTSAKQTSCIAEYLPQNIVPAVVDHEPVDITKNASYTWTGVDGQLYANVVILSRSLRPGCAYRFTFTVSDFEAGAPFFVASRGVNSYIPARNGTHVVDVYIVKSYDKLLYTYGGNQNADRRLTLTLDGIESLDNIGETWLDSAKQLPLNDEHLPPLRGSIGGYDLMASGAPQITHKPTLCQAWRKMSPMTMDGLDIRGEVDVPPQIVDGALRITCSGIDKNYDGGGTFDKIVAANVGDVVKWRFKIRASSTDVRAKIGMAKSGNLYYTNTYPRISSEWTTIEEDVTSIYPLDNFWIAKYYEYTGPGYFEIKDIEILIYRK